MLIGVTELTPVEQTALLTLYARALDSRWPRPILGDALADEVVGKIDYDFAGLGVLTSVVCQAALRAKMLDDRVCAFTAEHADAVVVDLGAGLNDGLDRTSPPRTVDWYSVDLPEVIALRDQVLPASPQAHSVAVSLADPRWPETIPADRPTMLIADGLLAFLSENTIIALFRRITEHFRSGELAFNDYGGVGWVSRAAVRLSPQKMFKDVGALRGYAGFKDAHHPEVWDPWLKLVEEASLAHASEVNLFPGWIRVATRLAGKTKTGARKARILRYRFAPL
jgi:O-methyltransferase involved in polyketide biosynthesis